MIDELAVQLDGFASHLRCRLLPLHFRACCQVLCIPSGRSSRAVNGVPVALRTRLFTSLCCCFRAALHTGLRKFASIGTGRPPVSLINKLRGS